MSRRRRLDLSRSGPWICWAGMAALAWTYVATFAYAPWWAAVVLVVIYLGFVFWALERTVGSRIDPVRATFVPFWALYAIVAVTGLGVLTLGW